MRRRRLVPEENGAEQGKHEHAVPPPNKNARALLRSAAPGPHLGRRRPSEEPALDVAARKLSVGEELRLQPLPFGVLESLLQHDLHDSTGSITGEQGRALRAGADFERERAEPLSSPPSPSLFSELIFGLNVPTQHCTPPSPHLTEASPVRQSGQK